MKSYLFIVSTFLSLVALSENVRWKGGSGNY